VAVYDESLDALRELQIIEQELMLMVSITSRFLLISQLTEGKQDLNKVETVLSEVESVLAACPATETLIFQQETLVKVWEHLAGVQRPVPIPPARKKGSRSMSINRVQLPEHCLGMFVSLSVDILTVRRVAGTSGHLGHTAA